MVDLRLYALLDPQVSNGRPLDALARDVIAGGATLLQLRDKEGSTREMIARARVIVEAARGSGVPVLVNDRIDVALAAGADGAHVGWDDMAAADARRLLGPDAIIGLSIKTARQVHDAPLDLLDYVCIGGVFRTTSKDNPDPPIGTDGLQSLVRLVRARKPNFPAGAIAGIDETNVAPVIAAGADGVAIISALSMAPDPKAKAAQLRALIDRALKERAAA